MSETKTELTFEEIVKDFKPQIVQEEFTLLLKHLKMTSAEFFQKYKHVTTQRFSLLKSVLIKAELTPRKPKEFERTEKVEFTVLPSEMGYSKSCEILLSSREEGVVNIESKSRMVESGIFLWKCTVTIPEIGEYADKYLSWHDGKIWLTDFAIRSMFTQIFDINKILSEQEGLSNIAESKNTRILIPESKYLLLKSQKMLFYCLSTIGNVEFEF